MKKRKLFPKAQKLTRLFTDFFESEKAGGVVLIFATAISLIVANSAAGHSYEHFWHTPLAGLSLSHWINDGLMAIFFLMIGLELERELYIGELSDLRSASLPIFGALGGMLVPAGIYLIFNWGTPAQGGAGIPMATDIAFAIGILSLLGKRVPASLKIFLTALAVIDDLGAIIVISVFYTSGLSALYLAGAMGVFAVLLLLNRLKVHLLLPYLAGGVLMWYLMLNSGVHATITGVLLAFAIPFGDGGEKSPSYQLQHFLHRPVAFVILPLFALANTAIIAGEGWLESFGTTASVGIIAGLALGKPFGIFLFTRVAAFLRVSSLPGDLRWAHIVGAGMLGGIGFTMSIFITLLAFGDATLINNSKMAILAASLASGLIGFIWLRVTLKTEQQEEN